MTWISHCLHSILLMSWCLLWSWLTARLFFALTIKRKTNRLWVQAQTFWPALILAPLTLLAAYKIAAWNLIYPASMLADWWELLLASIIPSIILYIAAGLPLQIYRFISLETNNWREKPFFTVAMAYGKKPYQQLWPIAGKKSLFTAWHLCLPWLFGELIIIECIFNTPGLGYASWQMARMQKTEALIVPLATLVAIYAIFSSILWIFTKRLGRWLDGYQ